MLIVQVPPMLGLWMLIERKLSRRAYDTSMMAPISDDDLPVLFNGKPGISSLWKILLAGGTPHIQVVWASPHDWQPRLLCESYIAVPEKLFFCASLQLCIRRCETLLGRAQVQKRHLGRLSTAPGQSLPPTGDEVFTAEVIGFAGRHLWYRLLRKVSGVFVRWDHWGVAVGATGDHAGYGSSSTDGPEVAWLKIPGRADRFYADPFLWRDETGRYHLFFEELAYSEKRGVISHVLIDASTRRFIGEPQVVLRRPYHLSYPYVFEYKGEMFMIPETSENRTIEVYRASEFPTCWALHKILMHDVIAADTTLYEEGGTWWMWTSLARDGEPNYDELSVFYADSPFGPWTPHPMNPVLSDCRSARMAGKVFRDKHNRLIRPAQDCENDYGASLRFCEVTELTRSTYAERVMLTWTTPKGYDGVHTWNAVGDITVVDVKSRLPRWAGWSVSLPILRGFANENRNFVLWATWQRGDGDGDRPCTPGDGPAGA
jgi:hypothetical protein